MTDPSNVWLHRISHHAEVAHPLLHQGVLSIGFSDFSSQEFLQRTAAGESPYFDQEFARLWFSNPRPKSRHSLWTFIHRMQLGDWVVVPSWGDFSICEIVGPARLAKEGCPDEMQVWHHKKLTTSDAGLYIEGSKIDLGFTRQVKKIAGGISRYEYADGPLTARMKIRTTTAHISDLRENVEKALTAFQKGVPLQLRGQMMVALQDKLLEVISKEVGPEKLESLLAWYFEGIGATSVTIPAKNATGKKGDADIVAVFEHLRTIYYVQAKKHDGETNSWAVQQIRDFKENHDRMNDGYSRIAWVVSTAPDFTSECRELAKESNVNLFNGPELAAMILDTGIQGIDTAFKRN